MTTSTIASVGDTCSTLENGEPPPAKIPGIRADQSSRYQFAIALLREHFKSDDRLLSGLDVFCGNGYGVYLIAQELSAHVLGLDGSAAAIEAANECYSTSRTIYAQKRFPFELAPATYDFITCFDSLELVQDWATLFGALVEALKPGGVLFLSTHNEAVIPLQFNAQKLEDHVKHFTVDDAEALATGRSDLALAGLFGQQVYRLDAAGRVLSIDESISALPTLDIANAQVLISLFVKKRVAGGTVAKRATQGADSVSRAPARPRPASGSANAGSLPCDPHRCLIEFFTPPAWVAGQISLEDAGFLEEMVNNGVTKPVIEIGVASGWSSAVLLHLLRQKPPSSAPDVWLHSYDVGEWCYFDSTRRVGAAVAEVVPELVTRWKFHIGNARDAGLKFSGLNADLAFIDADHRHPWATFDLIALLPALAPNAWVALHDISLPVFTSNPEWRVFGPKHLFDLWPWEKRSVKGQRNNIGAVRVPPDHVEVRKFCKSVLALPWETTFPKDLALALLLSEEKRAV